MFRFLGDMFGNEFGETLSVLLPDKANEIFKNLLQGRIELKEAEINDYLKNHMELNDERIKDVEISLQDGYIVVKGNIKPGNYLPCVSVNADFELLEWEFEKGSHYLNFQLINSPSYQVEGKLARYLSGVVNMMINKIMNGQTREGVPIFSNEYLKFIDKKIMFKIHEHPEMKKIINIEYAVRNIKIKPFDYISLDDIGIKHGRIYLYPNVSKSRLIKDIMGNLTDL